MHLAAALIVDPLIIYIQKLWSTNLHFAHNWMGACMCSHSVLLTWRTGSKCPIWRYILILYTCTANSLIHTLDACELTYIYGNMCLPSVRSRGTAERRQRRRGTSPAEGCAWCLYRAPSEWPAKPRSTSGHHLVQPSCSRHRIYDDDPGTLTDSSTNEILTHNY